MAGAQDPAFGETLAAEALKNGIVVEVTNPTGVAASGAAGFEPYQPKAYEPTPDVVAVHNMPRFHGTNKFSIKGINYFIGAGTVAAFQLLMAFAIPFLTCAYCCCPCCCCKTPTDKLFEPKPKCCGTPVPRRVANAIFVGIAVLILVVGISFGADGRLAFGNTFQLLNKTIDQISDTLGQVQTIMDDIVAGAASMDSALSGVAGCGLADGLKASTEAIKDASKQDINISNIVTPLETVQKQLNNVRGLVVLAADILLALPFVMGITFATAVLYIIFVGESASKGDAQTTVCLRWTVRQHFIDKLICLATGLSSFGMPFLMFLMFFIAVIFTVISVVVADMCITDPIDMLTTELSSQIGDMSYMLTCKGRPPAFVGEIGEMGELAVTGAEMASGFKLLFANSDEAGCQVMVDNDYAKTNLLISGFDTVGAAVQSVLAILSCQTVNVILRTLLHDTICGALLTAAYKTWQGLTMMGTACIILWFMYGSEGKRYRHRLMAVVPAGGDIEMGKKKGEKAPLTSSASTAD